MQTIKDKIIYEKQALSLFNAVIMQISIIINMSRVIQFTPFLGRDYAIGLQPCGKTLNAIILNKLFNFFKQFMKRFYFLFLSTLFFVPSFLFGANIKNIKQHRNSIERREAQLKVCLLSQRDCSKPCKSRGYETCNY